VNFESYHMLNSFFTYSFRETTKPFHDLVKVVNDNYKKSVAFSDWECPNLENNVMFLQSFDFSKNKDFSNCLLSHSLDLLIKESNFPDKFKIEEETLRLFNSSFMTSIPTTAGGLDNAGNSMKCIHSFYQLLKDGHFPEKITGLDILKSVLNNEDTSVYQILIKVENTVNREVMKTHLPTKIKLFFLLVFTKCY
jgi:hypothetical protein